LTLDLSNEGILKQLSYSSVNEALLNQVEKIKNNTNKFQAIEKHIFDLHKNLEKIDGFVAMSNSVDFFKIKHHESANEVQNKEFTELVEKWSEKYKIKVEKIKDSTYYIHGLNH
jgi:NAD(P)H-dependent flavin oxidoreductase YrpB (nitropropane dioxygenase family)